MILRLLSLFVIAAALLAAPITGSAAPQLPPVPGQSPKLLIYLAKGAADACGAGCDRWIAVEGTVDTDAAARVRQFLRDVKDSKLPFYFHSPGGDVRQAFAIGRMLRTRKAIGRVGQTMAVRCSGAQGDEACFKIKAGGGDVEARIVTRGAMCNSACGYLILGATVREIAPDAVMAVHNTRIMTEFHGHPTAVQRARFLSYAKDRSDSERLSFMASMGINPELVDLIKTVKFEDMHVLTRPELYRFGIDTRPVVETIWSIEPQRRSMRKVALVKQGDGRSFRTTEWRFYCEGPDRARFMFLREFEKDEAVTSTIAVTAGSDRPLAFGRYPSRLGSFEAWSVVMGAGDMKALLAVPHVQVSEMAAVFQGPPSQSVFEIGTEGLAAAWIEFSVACAARPGAAARPVVSHAGTSNPGLDASSEAFAPPSPGWGTFAPK